MEPPSCFEVDDEIIIVDRNHRIVAARLDQTGSILPSDRQRCAR
jgi:hypothetical protein